MKYDFVNFINRLYVNDTFVDKFMEIENPDNLTHLNFALNDDIDLSFIGVSIFITINKTLEIKLRREYPIAEILDNYVGSHVIRKIKNSNSYSFIDIGTYKITEADKIELKNPTEEYMFSAYVVHGKIIDTIKDIYNLNVEYGYGYFRFSLGDDVIEEDIIKSIDIFNQYVKDITK